MDDIWIEKYRPKTLKDIAGQKHIVERLQAYVKTKHVPHMIFAGPAGTGKTTSALALSKELYGDTWKTNFHELNASDERGIGIIRGKIKDFARTAPIGSYPFKIIFLDEADSLTTDAQAALRRTIERYTHICRFILSVNYSSKIIEPIQSETIIFVSQGDLRKAINVLQVGASISNTITADLLYETSATAKPADVELLISTALQGDFVGARNKLYDLLIKYGLSGEDIIKQIHRSIFDLSIPDISKIHLIEKTGEIEFRMTEGSNEHIQLETLLAQFALYGKNMK